MKIAIVILNWNGKELLEKFLPSIVQHSQLPNVAIYVADNASTDNSVSFLEQTYPTIQIINNTSNGGFAKGYNDALKTIEADIYALVNSDIEVTKNWLAPIIKTFNEEENTCIIQPKILDYKNKKLLEYAGAAGGFIDKYGYPYCRGRLFNELESDTGQYNDSLPIFWATGACFFIRSNVYHKLNGFDEDFFAHQEEIDLCWRAQNEGFQIKYIGNAEVYHVGGATLDKINSRKTYLNFRNSLLMLAKNLPYPKIAPIIFTRLILDGIAGAKFLFELKPKHTWAIVQAHFSFYALYSKMISKRSKNQSNNYYKVKSIVWQFYVKGNKKFTNL